MSDGDHQFEIVGVVRDSKHYTLREDFRPIVYTASSQVADPGLTTRYVLRTRAADPATTRQVRDALAEISPAAGVRFAGGRDLITDAMLRERLLAGLAGFFGIVALALATVGVYGIVAYTVATRRREIGIRRALGARGADVLGALLRRVGLVTIAGIAGGIALTVAISASATSLLYGVGPRDQGLLAIVVVTIAAAGIAATIVPARRALHVDPVSALKDE